MLHVAYGAGLGHALHAEPHWPGLVHCLWHTRPIFGHSPTYGQALHPSFSPAELNEFDVPSVKCKIFCLKKETYCYLKNTSSIILHT